MKHVDQLSSISKWMHFPLVACSSIPIYLKYHNDGNTNMQYNLILNKSITDSHHGIIIHAAIMHLRLRRVYLGFIVYAQASNERKLSAYKPQVVDV